MATIDRMDRLRRAVAEAAESLAREPTLGLDESRPPSPGDLYVFDTVEDAALEWLIVREHPDDPDLLLVAPVDDFPLAGTPDVMLPHELVGRPLTARCGEGLWLPQRGCVPRLRVGAVPQEALSLVRRKLADLFRGRPSSSDDQRQSDLDPEYEYWIGLVERSRELLQFRADQAPVELGQVIPFGQFTSRSPSELESQRPYALAAESGSPLVATLNQVPDAADAKVRYHEVALGSDGKLILAAEGDGIRAIWSGPAGSDPPRLMALSLDRPELTWHLRPEGHLHRAEPLAPWVNDQAVLEIGTEPPQRLTIQK